MDEKIINTIKDLLIKNDIEYAALFGSRARGDNHPDSDYDILIRFKKNKEKGLFEFIGLEDDLSEILKKKVDLVVEDSLSPYIRDYVLKDLKVIYQ
ncbi:MAG: nucleotidyltransferase family protein [bacterium]|nr:nucleotidyltransferase family protein [bacterium]